MGFFSELGVDPRHLVFSSDTSEEQGRQYGKGRGTVDCCYPVKCIAGHYGELIFGQREKVDVLFSPMIYNLPSFLSGHVARTLTCPRVMAAPENIKAGFMKERDVFAEQGIRYAAPFVSLDEPKLVPKQLWEGLRDAIPGLTAEETAGAAGNAAPPSLFARMRDEESGHRATKRTMPRGNATSGPRDVTQTTGSIIPTGWLLLATTLRRTKTTTSVGAKIACSVFVITSRVPPRAGTASLQSCGSFAAHL